MRRENIFKKFYEEKGFSFKGFYKIFCDTGKAIGIRKIPSFVAFRQYSLLLRRPSLETLLILQQMTKNQISIKDFIEVPSSQSQIEDDTGGTL